MNDFPCRETGKIPFCDCLVKELPSRNVSSVRKVICLKSLKKTRSGTSVACLSLFQLVVLSRITFFGIECFILSSF